MKGGRRFERKKVREEEAAEAGERDGRKEVRGKWLLRQRRRERGGERKV